MAVQRKTALSVSFRIAVCLVLLVAGLGIFRALESRRRRADVANLVVAPMRVQVIRPVLIEVRRQWEGFGTAWSMEAADVPARVTSTVVERAADMRPGRSVRRGELIARLDESDFARQVEIAAQAINDIQAQLERLAVEEQSCTKRAELAAADVKLATAEYERIRGAFEREAAKEREVDIAQRTLNAAMHSQVAAREELDKIAPRRAALSANRLSHEATLRLAQQDLERCRVVSPIDGVLQDVDVEIGENIMAGQRIARVVSLDRVEVPLLLPSSARAHVRVGDDVTLRGSGRPGRVWQARVTRIAPEDDSSTRTMRVYAEHAQDSAVDGALAPGQFVEGRVVSGQPVTRCVVPRRALSSERLKIVRDGIVDDVPVAVEFHIEQSLPQFGLPDLQWVVLAEPVPEDSLVVVDGSRSLAPGSPVEAVVAGQADSLATQVRSGGSVP